MRDLSKKGMGIDIENDFNPLYITQGNTDLTPEKNDDFSIMFYSHEFKKATSFSIDLALWLT